MNALLTKMANWLWVCVDVQGQCPSIQGEHRSHLWVCLGDDWNTSSLEFDCKYASAWVYPGVSVVIPIPISTNIHTHMVGMGIYGGYVRVLHGLRNPWVYIP